MTRDSESALATTVAIIGLTVTAAAVLAILELR